MERRRSIARVVVMVLAILVAVPALAGFAGTDVFLPSVGAKPGVAPAVWYTTVWVHNPNATAANITVYLLERQANPAPLTYTDTIPSGDTRKYENAVQTMFARQTFGALRVTSNVKVVVGSRIYSQSGDLEDSVGQFFAGTPASFAIGAGQSTELVGAYGTLPAASSTFRYNYGFVETTGTGTCQVKVTVNDALGTPVGWKTYTLRQWEQLQKGLKDEFPSLSTQNARLTVEVTSGTGKVIAFGSSVANGSQDPATFEMAFRDSLLAENSTGGLSEVSHDGTLEGTGTSSSPLGIADGGVTAGHISTGQVVKSVNGLKDAVTFTAGSNVSITPSGQTLTISATPGGGGGDITAVTAGTGLSGGGTSGDVALAIADSGVTAGKIASGQVVKSLNGLEDAVTLAPGANITLTPSGNTLTIAATGGGGTGVPSVNGITEAVTIAGSGGTTVNTSGSTITVGSPAGGLTLPYSGAFSGSTPAFSVTNPGTDMAVFGGAPTGIGVAGGTQSGKGVLGQASSGIGVRGDATDGIGVVAWASQGTGLQAGSLNGRAVEATTYYGALAMYAENQSANGIAIAAHAPGVAGMGISGRGGSTGVSGTSVAGVGVLGESASSVGVTGGSTSGFGVSGYSANADGVHGSSTSGNGVSGENLSGGDGTAGVKGTNTGSQGVGVWGQHNGSGWGVFGSSDSSHAVHGSTGSGVGIFGVAWSTGGYAGWFQGDVNVTGTLSKSGGSFKIDHPQDPGNRYLAHSFVESPDMMNVYNGNVVTDDEGRAVVELPAYFETLNRDFRYQLTVIGRFAQAIVEEEVVGNRFVIRTNLAGVKVSWQVTGIRRDPWAEAHRIVVEQDKPAADRGHYLHPELYGARAEEGIGRVPEPVSGPARAK